MPDGLEAVADAIDTGFERHEHYQTEPYDSGVAISFKLEKRFFRVRVTKEYDQDYGSKSIKKLDPKEFAEALRKTPDGNLTVNSRGFLNE